MKQRKKSLSPSSEVDLLSMLDNIGHSGALMRLLSSKKRKVSKLIADDPARYKQFDILLRNRRGKTFDGLRRSCFVY